MSISITPNARLIALVGLLCACALGGAALMLARKQATTTTSAPPATTAHLHARTTVTAHHGIGARHHTTSATAAPSVTQKPKPAGVVIDARIPTAVGASLKNHSVVVAALYAPDAATDPTAVSEAQAGAQLAGVGFVKLDVLDETTANQLARVADHLSDPAVLVFRRSGVAVRIDGFADRDLVAQAAQNAENAASR